MYALETAMDELAVKLGIDPIELRRVNDTMTEPIEGRPFSSRSLMKCYDQAAESFGWMRRSPQPGSIREGEWLLVLSCSRHPSCHVCNRSHKRRGDRSHLRICAYA